MRRTNKKDSNNNKKRVGRDIFRVGEKGEENGFGRRKKTTEDWFWSGGKRRRRKGMSNNLDRREKGKELGRDLDGKVL